MDSVEDKVISIVAEELGRPKGDVKLTSNFESDLGADSFDKMEISIAIEDEFDLVMEDSDVDSVDTVKDLVDYVEEHSKK